MTDLELAQLMADLADRMTLDAYRSDSLVFDTKPDGTIVTNADTDVETALRRLLGEHRPGEGILGEEHGASGPARPRWILDPIDGTSSFATGELEWGTLIARQDESGIGLALVSSPALQHRWWAERGAGAWAVTPRTHDSPIRLRISPMDVIEGARVAAWPPPHRLDPERGSLAQHFHHKALEVGADLRGVDVKPARGTGFPGGAVMVAAGVLDGFLLPGGGPWDLAPSALLVEEAGGTFTDLAGNQALGTGGGLFTNGHLHPQLAGWIGDSYARIRG